MEGLQVSFAIVTLLSIVGLSLAVRHDRRILLLYISWLVLSGILALTHFFEDVTSVPPRFLFLIIPAILITLVALRLIKYKALSLKWLLAIHVIRIPVELILYNLYLEGMIPRSMTFEGTNWDILSGLSALVILIFLGRGRISTFLLKLWNWAGLLLLLNIVATAILSAPTPIQQLAFDQPNVAVLHFPFTWLPAVVVPIVLLSHLLIFRYINQHSS